MIDPRKSGTDSLDILFEVLSDKRRRSTLSCLKKYDTPLALADLAEAVAIQEYGAPITEVVSEDVKQIYISLYHAHIPKLDDVNIIQYDQETDVVTLNESSEQLELCFELLESG